jgi:hypothetical protein
MLAKAETLMDENGRLDFETFYTNVMLSEDIADQLKAEDMRCKPKQIDELLLDEPRKLWQGDKVFKFWKWLKPLEVNDFYALDDYVTGLGDAWRIFNENAIFAEWKEKNSDGDVVYYSGMRHKSEKSPHGIVRIEDRQKATIVEACYKNNVLHGLYRQVSGDKCFYKTYNNGEEVAHQSWERNLTRIMEGGDQTMMGLMFEMCQPADLIKLNQL